MAIILSSLFVSTLSFAFVNKGHTNMTIAPRIPNTFLYNPFIKNPSCSTIYSFFPFHPAFYVIRLHVLIMILPFYCLLCNLNTCLYNYFLRFCFIPFLFFNSILLCLLYIFIFLSYYIISYYCKQVFCTCNIGTLLCFSNVRAYKSAKGILTPLRTFIFLRYNIHLQSQSLCHPQYPAWYHCFPRSVLFLPHCQRNGPF